MLAFPSTTFAAASGAANHKISSSSILTSAIGWALKELEVKELEVVFAATEK